MPMFGFLKDKLKKALDKIRNIDKSLKEEQKENKQKIKKELKEVQEIKKEEEKLEEKKEKLEKKEEKLEKEEKAAQKQELKEIKAEEKDIKEEIKEVKQEIKEVEKEEKEKVGFLEKIKQKILATNLDNETFEEVFQPIELTLIENNFSMKIIQKLRGKLEKELIGKPFRSKEIEQKIKDTLKNVLSDSIKEPFDLVERIKQNKDKPFVIVFFGINGAGKTTSIAKIVKKLQDNNLTSVLAAGDTFRAASIEQLQKHADKLGVKVIKHDYGADPAAVAFDAIKHAKSKNIQAVLIDTAGRMHTKADLMKEMEKICRVAKPNLKIFVGEAITGSDLLEQLEKFNEAIGIDAAILTKVDVDEKGGAMISIGEVTGKPIIYLGTGQKYEDLQMLDKKKIINSIF